MNRPAKPTETNGEHGDSFLPDFCTARVVFLLVLIAELLAIVLALVSSGSMLELWTDLALISLFIQWVNSSCDSPVHGFFAALPPRGPSSITLRFPICPAMNSKVTIVRTV